MGFFDGLRALFNAPKTEEIENEELKIDIDERESPVSVSDFVSYLKTELERRRGDRWYFELQWILNSNFLNGHQHCDINTKSHKIETVEPEFDYLENGVYNRIAPIFDTRLASLRNVKFAMTVRPATAELDDLGKADISTELLRYTQNKLGWDDLKNKLYNWSELTGTAFVLSYWDPSSGKVIGETEDGMKVHEGDIECGILTPYEVFPESLYKEDISSQRNIITDQVMSVDEIYDRYGLRVEGKDCDTYIVSPIPGAGGYGTTTYISTVVTTATAKVHDSEHVITYYEQPSKKYPSGRIAVVIGDKLIHYGEMPYSCIPINMVKCKEVAGQFFGKTYVQDLIPWQRAYNGCVNSLHDYIKASCNEPLLVPQGSVRDVDDIIMHGLAPNQVIEYRNEMGQPTFLSHSGIPQNITNEIHDIVNNMEYAAGISTLMAYGTAPAGVKSGKALENLREIDNTRISLSAENMRNMAKALAVVWLHIYKTFCRGYRVCNIVGENQLGNLLVWCSDEINSYDIVYDTVNELALSEEQQKENFLQAYQMGLFADERGVVPSEIKQKAIEALRVGTFTPTLSLNDEQSNNAKRENSFVEAGVIPVLDELDDDYIHLSEHKRYALQYRFRRMEKVMPEITKEFRNHIKAHEMRIAQREEAARQAALQAQMTGENR